MVYFILNFFKMALKPSLKSKVNELFLRWYSDSEVQALLRLNLKQIQSGDAISTSSGSHFHVSGANVAAFKALKVFQK